MTCCLLCNIISLVILLTKYEENKLRLYEWRKTSAKSVSLDIPLDLYEEYVKAKNLYEVKYYNGGGRLSFSRFVRLSLDNMVEDIYGGLLE